jgi:hypothetical protein
MPKREKKIKVDMPEAFVKWALENSILFGPNIEIWWKEEGIKNFYDWAKKRNIEYVFQDSNKKGAIV